MTSTPASPMPPRQAVPDHDAPQLRVLLGSAGGEAVLRFAGEIDITTTGIVAAAADRCLQDRSASLILDLTSVTFCDCAGVRALRQTHQQAIAAGVDVSIIAPGMHIQRAFSLMGAGDLLAVTDPSGSRAEEDKPAAGRPAVEEASPAGRGPAVMRSLDEGTGSGAVFLAPPAPPPEAVSAARRHLNEQYANGMQRLLWDLDKQPMPDLDAVRHAIAASRGAEAAGMDAAGVDAALVLLRAARLGLDRLESEVFDAAHAADISDDALAAALDLPDARAANARHRWLRMRRALPYEPEPVRLGVPASPAEAAARAERRARQAAGRLRQIVQRVDQLKFAAGQPRRSSREYAERSAGHAGEARILAGEAIERTVLGLLRAAEAQERCATGYERLAGDDTAHRDEYWQEATWYWRAAQEYRRLAGQYGPGRSRPR